MINRKVDRRDIVIALALGAGIWSVLFFFLGFYKIGFNAPYAYSGGDDFIFLANIKSIGDNGWFWNNQYLGAPYGAEQYGYPLLFGMNFECLLTKIIYFFTHSAIVTANIQFLLIFALCAISAYLVLRELNISRILSIFGAILFALAPYIFGRNIGHFNLSACYFVPLSVLLCVWSFEEDGDYLVLNRGFFKNRKNWLTILFALLIANNGTVYYPFFTCFLLCVTALYKSLSCKRLKACLSSLKIIMMIVLFLVVAVAPVLVYIILGGGTKRSQRCFGCGNLWLEDCAVIHTTQWSWHWFSGKADFII